MSWNILNGGHSNEPSRVDSQAEVIGRTSPDVLLVQEARGFLEDSCRVLFDAEHRWGLRGFVGRATDTGQHTGVFVRPPLVPLAFTADTVHFHHVASTLTVRHPAIAQPLSFTSVHLCPTSPGPRRSEAAHLAGLCAPDQLALVGGDCNSPSPGDPPVDLAPLPARFRVRYDDGTGDADRGAIATMLAAGFVDVADGLDDHTPTVPTAGFPDAEFVPFRCDFFLATPALAGRVASYRVVVDDLAATASDHAPIVTELAFA